MQIKSVNKFYSLYLILKNLNFVELLQVYISKTYYQKSTEFWELFITIFDLKIVTIIPINSPKIMIFIFFPFFFFNKLFLIGNSFDYIIIIYHVSSNSNVSFK